MLEPFTALGVASSVVQLVEFGGKLLALTTEAIKSPNGLIEENVDVEIVAADLRSLTYQLGNAPRPLSKKSPTDGGETHSRTLKERLTRIRARPSEIPPTSDDYKVTDDERLWKLANRCHEVSQDLLEILDDIRSKGNGTYRTWNAVRQAIQTVRKKGDIEDLQKRLEPLRGELLLNLVRITRNEQSDVHKWLADLIRTSRQAQIDNVAQLQQQRSDLLRAAQKHHHAIEDISRSLQKQQISTSDAEAKAEKIYENVIATLRAVEKDGRDIAKCQSILASLCFKEMPMRHIQIPETYANTFSWIFDSYPFRPWLETSGGVFWISGKPGSGKSTLMKMLFDSGRTRETLNIWAGGQKLVVASFFFWYSGFPMQKSQEGLLQSLLHQILRQCPYLIPIVCAKRWRADETFHLDPEPWSKTEMLEMLTSILNKKDISARICFFIDGLDEYTGEHHDLVQTFANFSRSSAVKICVSSRPWNAFRKAYDGLVDRRLILQDLTKADMDRYIKGKLEEDPQFQTLASSDPSARLFAEEIRNKAQGVFFLGFLGREISPSGSY